MYYFLCLAKVTTSTQELRAESTPSELQLHVTCSSSTGAGSREPSQQRLPATCSPYQSRSRGDCCGAGCWAQEPGGAQGAPLPITGPTPGARCRASPQANLCLQPLCCGPGVGLRDALGDAHTWGCSRQSNRARREEVSGSLGVSPRELCDHVVAQPGSQRLSALVPLEKAVVLPPRVSSGGQVREEGAGWDPPQARGSRPPPRVGPTDWHAGRLKATESIWTSRSSGLRMRQRKPLSRGGVPQGLLAGGGADRQGRGGPRAAASRGNNGSRRPRGLRTGAPGKGPGGRAKTPLQGTSASSTGRIGDRRRPPLSL